MFSSKDIFFTGSSGYRIAKSLRFRSSASAYLNRTPGSAGNRKTWTWSAWVKRGTLGATQVLFIGYVDANNKTRIDISSTDILRVYDITGGSTERVKVYTTQVLRDTGSWYHIVVALDTTSATSTITGSSTDRVRLYINGVQVTAFSSTVAPSQNADLYVDATNAHNVGGSVPDALYFDGYLAEVNFIDGQALTPSSFGQSNATTGVWQPKAYTGTYGTNGFYLKFTTVGATSGSNTGYGQDFSGNGNYWTTNNLSSTSGVTYDSMWDTPTPYDDGGNGVGNYCILNPLNFVTTAPINANLRLNLPSGGAVRNYGSMGVSSGKWYFEVTITAFNPAPSNGYMLIGISYTPTPTGSGRYTYIGTNDTSIAGYKNNGTTSTAYGANYTVGDVVGVAYDLDAATITFYKNNVSQGTAFTSITSGTYFPIILNDGSASNPTTYDANFGQRPFTYTPPSGFKALNTQNLPTPTIAAGGNYMAAVLYSGTSASNTVVATSSNSGNNPLALTFQPDLVWIKSRSAATNHELTDAVRGVTKSLVSNSTAAEATDTNGLTAFTSTGFTVGSDSNYNNGTGPATYVAWEWKGGNGTVSNTSGSITSTVSANTTAGFSIVTYTGTGANATVGHGLGVAPDMIIVKRRDTTSNWQVRHTSITAANSIQLNLTNAAASATTVWNSTAPTSTVFSVGTDATVNANGGTYVAYCFAAVAGYSAFGSYTGNGSADGPFVFTGFRPRYVMIKRTDTTSDWYLWDTARDTYNVVSATLLADTSGAETSAASIDGLSNGFKCRSATVVNVSTGTYIYATFAENPFKYALAR